MKLFVSLFLGFAALFFVVDAGQIATPKVIGYEGTKLTIQMTMAAVADKVIAVEGKAGVLYTSGTLPVCTGRSWSTSTSKWVSQSGTSTALTNGEDTKDWVVTFTNNWEAGKVVIFECDKIVTYTASSADIVVSDDVTVNAGSLNTRNVNVDNEDITTSTCDCTTATWVSNLSGLTFDGLQIEFQCAYTVAASKEIYFDFNTDDYAKPLETALTGLHYFGQDKKPTTDANKVTATYVTPSATVFANRVKYTTAADPLLVKTASTATYFFYSPNDMTIKKSATIRINTNIANKVYGKTCTVAKDQPAGNTSAAHRNASLVCAVLSIFYFL